MASWLANPLFPQFGQRMKRIMVVVGLVSVASGLPASFSNSPPKSTLCTFSKPGKHRHCVTIHLQSILTAQQPVNWGSKKELHRCGINADNCGDSQAHRPKTWKNSTSLPGNMFKHSLTMPISSWRAHYLQLKDVLNSRFPEGQQPKSCPRFLDKVYMGYCGEKSPQMQDVSKHLMNSL